MLASLTASWSFALPELLRVLAYSLTGTALFLLFRSRQTTILGRRRWLLVAAMGGLAALQVAGFLALMHGLTPLAHLFGLVGACVLFATAAMLWPYLGFIRASLLAARDEEVKERLRVAEAKAAEAKSWLLLAEEIAHVGHWRVSYPDMTLFWSDQIFRIHGLAPGRDPPDLATAVGYYHPDDVAQVQEKVEQALKSGTNYEVEARLVRRDGEVRHVLSRAKVETDQNGQVTALFGVFVDITARKLMEDRLLAENAKVEQDNRSLLELAMRDSLTSCRTGANSIGRCAPRPSGRCAAAPALAWS